MKYDIANRLVYKKPTVKISEDKEFKINTSKNCVMLFNQKVKTMKDDSDEDIFDIGIKMFLGEEAFNEINNMDLPVKQYEIIYNTIMAAIEEISLEEYEERQKAREDKNPSGSK